MLFYCILAPADINKEVVVKHSEGSGNHKNKFYFTFFCVILEMCTVKNVTNNENSKLLNITQENNMIFIVD